IQIAKAAGRYKGRPEDKATHQRIVALRSSGYSIAETAKLAECSQSQVKRISALEKTAKTTGSTSP
ncbi:helix-turn-helix domain-containing protein, partial [Pantoea sp. ANP04]